MITMLKLPRSGTISRQVLEFIGERDGSRYSDIVRFICELQGKNYDTMETVFAYRNGRRIQVPSRRWRGWWSTNLCHGESALLKKYCDKGEDRKWRLTPETSELINPAPPVQNTDFDIDDFPEVLTRRDAEDGTYTFVYERPAPKPTLDEAVATLMKTRVECASLSKELEALRVRYREALDAQIAATSAVRELLEI